LLNVEWQEKFKPEPTPTTHTSTSTSRAAKLGRVGVGVSVCHDYFFSNFLFEILRILRILRKEEGRGYKKSEGLV
jgi:hypothetical protein